MRVLRNPDVCALTLTTAAVGIAASGICFYFNQKAGLIAAAAFVIVISAQLVNAALRHRHFRKLADEIDGILHGAETYAFQSIVKAKSAYLKTSSQS